MTKLLPRILVVDDEQHQLATVCRGLRIHGYHCQGVTRAEAALAALAAHAEAPGETFDLVLTDLTMPGGSGLALIEQLRQRWPELPLVVITGLATSPETRLLREWNIPLLHKPFDPDTLDATIRQALGRK